MKGPLGARLRAAKVRCCPGGGGFSLHPGQEERDYWISRTEHPAF